MTRFSPVARSRNEAYNGFKTEYSVLNGINKFCDGYDQCFSTTLYKAKAPKIAIAKEAFGNDKILSWLNEQINIINEACGNKGKLAPAQIMMLSALLMKKFENLNVEEISLFFYKILQGDYGHFYGNIDIITIGEYANTFLSWRLDQIERVDNAQKAAKMAEDERLREERGFVPPEMVKSFLNQIYEKFK